ncbi:MAG: hypothetical protein ACRYFU_03355 [Janthinobacterium lividum]
MKSTSSLLLLLYLVLAPFVQAQAPTTIKLNLVSDGVFTVHATIAGHEGTFLFDSGAGISNISPDFAASIKCRPWGQITGFRMTGQRLDMPRCDHVAFTLAGRSFPASTVGVIDMTKFLPSEVGHIDGTIALDLLANQVFTLSYAGHFIRILDRNALSQTVKGLHSMPVHVVRDAEGLAVAVNLPVSTSAGTAWFEMDSGNGSGLVVVNKALAPLFDLTEGKDLPVSLSLEDGTTFIGPARVLDLILDGNLGASFLSRHDVTIDLPHHKAWVSPETRPAKQNRP